MKKGPTFVEEIKFLCGLIAEINKENISNEILLRLMEQYKKWYGFHTPTGLIIGSEKRLTKMGLGSILRYQLQLNIRLKVSADRTPLENNLLMCLASWMHEDMLNAIAKENLSVVAAEISATPRSWFVVKTEGDDWWLLVDNHEPVQAV